MDGWTVSGMAWDPWSAARGRVRGAQSIPAFHSVPEQAPRRRLPLDKTRRQNIRLLATTLDQQDALSVDMVCRINVVSLSTRRTTSSVNEYVVV
jgi:hypothetical protein